MQQGKGIPKGWKKEEKKNVGGETTPTSIKEKETLRSEVPYVNPHQVREGREAWKVTEPGGARSHTNIASAELRWSRLLGVECRGSGKEHAIEELCKLLLCDTWGLRLSVHCAPPGDHLMQAPLHKMGYDYAVKNQRWQFPGLSDYLICPVQMGL